MLCGGEKMLLLCVLATALAQEAGCPDPAAQLQEVHDAVMDARDADARDRMNAFWETLGCSGQLSAELLSLLWMTEGVRLYKAGDRNGMLMAFASSSRLAELEWPQAYGPDLHQEYMSSRELLGEEELSLSDIPPNVKLYLNGELYRNGERSTFSRTMPVGGYVLQMATEDGVIVATEHFMLSGGEPFAYIVGPLELPTTPVSAARSRRPGLLVGAGVAALAAGGMYALASSQSDAMSSAATLDDLDASYRRQKLYAGATYGLAGASVLGLGLYFAF